MLTTEKPRNCKSVTHHIGILRKNIIICLPFKFLFTCVPSIAEENWKMEMKGALVIQLVKVKSPRYGTECWRLKN